MVLLSKNIYWSCFARLYAYNIKLIMIKIQNLLSLVTAPLKRHKMKKFFISILALFVLLCIWVGLNWEHWQRFPSVMPSFYAKQMCSCLHVLERSEDFCHNFARQYIPISSYKIEKKDNSVTVKAFGRTEKAFYISPKHGCRLK